MRDRAGHYLLHFVFAHEPMEIFVVVVSTQVRGFEKPITLKLVPLIIPNIRVGAEVTLIDTVTHAS